MIGQTILPSQQPVIIVLAELWQCTYQEAVARERALSPDLRGQLSVALNRVVSNLSEGEELLIGQVLGKALLGLEADWSPVRACFQAVSDFVEVMRQIEVAEAQMPAATAATEACAACHSGAC